MRNPSIHLRVEPKLLEKLEKDAKRKSITVQVLLRQLIKAKYQRKPRARPFEFEDLFAGPPKRKIRTYEDYFSEKKR